MRIEVENLGKKFGRNWIFRGINLSLRTGEPVAILGANGSGKSTLMHILSGQLLPTEGTVSYYDDNDQLVPPEKQFAYINWVAPYIELIEEMTLHELLRFHTAFRPLSGTATEIMQGLDLQKAAKREIRHFSSGMKQRLRLGLAFYDCTASVLLLDEPSANLDVYYTNWYRNQLQSIAREKLIVIASNLEVEYQNLTKRNFSLSKIRKPTDID